MAESIFNKLAAGKHRAFSCGTKVSDKEGKSMHGQKLKDLSSARETLDSLAALGIDASESQRDQLTPELLAQADIVVVMAEPHTIPDFLKDRQGLIVWDVEDPKGKDRVETDAIREKITALVTGLLGSLATDSK